MESFPTILGLCLAQEDEAYLQEALKDHANLVTSLSPMMMTLPKGTSDLTERSADIVAAKDSLGRLVPGLPWPGSPQDVSLALQMKVTSSRHWLYKNLVTLAATKAVVYVVDDLTVRNIDMATVLVACRLIGGLSIGLLPIEARTTIDTTQLTLTDAVVGAEEPRAIAALLGSLKGGTTTSG